MLSVAEARERIISGLRPVSTEAVGLAECARRVLAEDILATSDLPLFDNSSMDGFAVRAADTAPLKGLMRLHVVADVRAGDAATIRISDGEAARIMTGAQLPEGADAVVPVEDTDFAAGAPGAAAPEWVSLARSVRVGENVRPRGQDAREGDPMLSTGQLLRAQDLGLLAMLGIGAVPVFRKPHVALFSSGDELLDVGAPLSPGMVRDTNTYTLGVLIEQSGAEFIRLGVAGDEYGAVESQLEKAVAANADLIISSAGVSVGALDFVKEVVAAHGTLDFWRVNMRPGKPLAFGAYRGIPFIGLPGNPVSAFVTFEVFARPAIGRLAGLPEAARERVRVRLAEEVRSDGRESYLRAEIREQEGELVARLTGHQGSGNLLALVRANALLIIPAGVECVPAKREVDAWLL